MTHHAPLVSVVIPAFNKAAFLPETLESVFNQTFTNYEIILVNDGSTDNTLQVLQSIAAARPDKSIRIIDKVNGGVSQARNTAIAEARGTYITTIDADDLMHPHYMAKAVEHLQAGHGNLVSCYVELFGKESGEWTPSAYETYRERYHNDIPTLVTYHRDLWAKSGGYKRAFPFNEDWDFFVASEQHGLQVVQLQEKLFRYRVTEDGLASLFIKDTWNFSVSLIMTSNQALYPVSQVYEAHRTLAAMPQRWIERFTKQDALHQQEWLLKFWLALVLKQRNDVESAKTLLIQAAQLTNMREWQPLFHLAEISHAQGDTATALAIYHQCRIVRPDSFIFMTDKLK